MSWLDFRKWESAYRAGGFEIPTKFDSKRKPPAILTTLVIFLWGFALQNAPVHLGDPITESQSHPSNFRYYYGPDKVEILAPTPRSLAGSDLMKIIFVCDAAGGLTAINESTGVGAGLAPNEFLTMKQRDLTITNPCEAGLTSSDTADLADFAGYKGLTTYPSMNGIEP